MLVTLLVLTPASCPKFLICACTASVARKQRTITILRMYNCFIKKKAGKVNLPAQKNDENLD
jgi:hypothetical protein